MSDERNDSRTAIIRTDRQAVERHFAQVIQRVEAKQRREQNGSIRPGGTA